MRYLDSASRDPGDTLFTWLQLALHDATYFGVQSGYFSYDGLYPMEPEVRDLLDRDGTLRLAVGANEGGVRREDLEAVLDLVDSALGVPTVDLTLIGAEDVLMHPKTYYVEKSDGTIHALVGSANFTHFGLSRNIEAAVAIDSVSDPGAPFDKIRTAIERWSTPGLANAYPVTRTSLARLVSDGVLDQAVREPPRLAPKSRMNRAKTFPRLGRILNLPRKRRTVGPPAPVTTSSGGSVAVLLGTVRPLPGGAIGIIRRLSDRDTSGFRGESGTDHISLPPALAQHLPMVPFGKNSEPRVDVSVEARLEGVPAEVIRSSSSPTNITHVGAGTSGTSHRDLRFNYLTHIRRGIERLAIEHSVPPPKENDLAAIELIDGILVRVTFVTDPVSIANLAPLLGGSNWGWLPHGVIAEWAGEDDA